jgi:hypothetical protein
MAVEEEFNKLTIAAGRIIDDEMARIKIVNMTETDFFPYNPIQ